MTHVSFKTHEARQSESTGLILFSAPGHGWLWHYSNSAALLHQLEAKEEGFNKATYASVCLDKCVCERDTDVSFRLLLMKYDSATDTDVRIIQAI